MPANSPANQAAVPLVNQAAPKAANPPGKVTRFFTARFRLWGKWMVGLLFASFAIICLLVYLAVQWFTYTTLVWGNGSSSAVTLSQDIGHGGISEITVTFNDHTLLVTDLDGSDPQRVTVMKVNEEIAIPDSAGVVTADLQNILQSNRLDLIIRIKGGLAYHTEFTTILVNNVDAVKKNPQAPGFRQPTADELQQALQKLGS